MSVTSTERPSRTRRANTRGFRPDIQALRAIAIGSVVLNHLWPVRFTGGYVGVDVFFVISGFLITSHLLREAFSTGRVSLSRFYARRVRRLLPAALLVLVVSACGVAVFLPYPRWQRNGAEIIASATYVENWFLAAMSVNYSALNDSATVAQHYWSLSVEEQFYLVWPLIILGAWALASWRGIRHRIPVFAALAVLGLLSLSASVYFTAATPSQAYFVTYTRVWEFAAGGIIALLAHRIRFGSMPRNLLSLGGFAAIGASVFLLRAESPFPGLLALVPVLGTVAVIVAGTGGGGQWHSAISSSRPVQWLGDVSYSLYLWHWPLIVLAPFVLSSAPTTASKVGVLVVALIAAWLSRRWVESPGQSWKLLRESTKRTFIAALIGMAVAVLAGSALIGGFSAKSAADQPSQTVAPAVCVGPAALAGGSRCADPFGPAEDPVMGPRNEYFWMPAECGDFDERLRYGDKLTTRECDFSQGARNAPHVWLVGDSHAQQWQNAIFDIARQKRWHVTISFFGGCPVADVTFQGFRGVWSPADAARCSQWSREVTAEIARESPSVVFTSMAARRQLVDDGSGRAPEEQFEAGLEKTWRVWTAAGSRVVVLADPPMNGEVRSPDCVALNVARPLTCSISRRVAQPADPLVTAATAIQDPSVTLVDLTDSFCDPKTCYAVVGGIVVYYDADHLNLEYVRLLSPSIAAMLTRDGFT